MKNVVELAKERWEYTWTFPPLKPKFTLYCLPCKFYCGEFVEMDFKEFYPHVRDYPDIEGISKYRIDIGYKCPKCGNIIWFGVPIEKYYFDWLIKEMRKVFGRVGVIRAIDLLKLKRS